MNSDSHIRILTLNCWGLKYVSAKRAARLAAIANELANSSYDIIALQEVWVQTDYLNIKESVAASLPYAKFFYSGALGSGLALFSRFAIVESSIRPYSLNGAPLDVIAGDWFVGKAATSVTISHPILGLVQIFNTHFFAKGGEDGPEHLRAHRLINAWEFSKLVKTAADLGRYVLAVGDFNSIPTTLPISIVREHGGLVDAWAASHTSTLPTGHESSPAVMIERYGVTADSPVNSWSAMKSLDKTARKYMGKRLDYIFYRQPSPSPSRLDAPVLSCSYTKVVFTENIPELGCSFSDHFGLEAHIDIQTPEHSTSVVADQNPARISSESLHATVRALTACFRFSRLRSRQELFASGICVAILLLLVFVSPWLSISWLRLISTIFAILLGWCATTFFYEGFLYGRWERNALLNVIEELEIVLSVSTQ